MRTAILAVVVTIFLGGAVIIATGLLINVNP